MRNFSFNAQALKKEKLDNFREAFPIFCRPGGLYDVLHAFCHISQMSEAVKKGADGRPLALTLLIDFSSPGLENGPALKVTVDAETQGIKVLGRTPCSLVEWFSEFDTNDQREVLCQVFDWAKGLPLSQKDRSQLARAWRGLMHPVPHFSVGQKSLSL